MNSSAETLTGYLLSEAVQLTALDMVSEDSIERLKSLIHVASISKEDQTVKESDLLLKKKSGREFYASVSASSVENNQYCLLSVEDLSSLKAAEAERAAAHMNNTKITKLADLGLIAGGLAHELNNPLSILMGYIEHLEAAHKEGRLDTQEINEAIDALKGSATRMKGVLSRMLTPIQAQKPVIATHNLNQIIEETFKLWHQALGDRTEQIKCENLDYNVMCDLALTRQVLDNLVKNAIEATEQSTDKTIRLKVLLSNQQATLLVWSSAPIPQEAQKHIFTPFFTTKAPGKGTGLGLYMCLSAMRAQGGDLSFESSDKAGTTFRLTFKLPAR